MRVPHGPLTGLSMVCRRDIIRKAAAIALLAVGVSASAQAGSDKGAQLEMRDMAAHVIITPEPREDIDVRVMYGTRKVPTLMVSHRGQTTILSGNVHNWGQLFPKGAPSREELPTVFIRVPLNVVIKDASYASGVVGPAQSLDFIYSGSGDWHVEPVKGHANLIATGTGRLHATSAGTVQIDSTGTSNVIVGRAGRLRASLSGSGTLVVETSGDTTLQNSGNAEVHFGTVDALSTRMFGSGKISVRRVNGTLNLVNNGSGDIHIQSLSGPAELFLSGSGNVSIKDGQAARFVLKGSGSGNVYFGGIAGAVNVNSFGSGNIYIRQTTGPVISKIRGSGEARIGENTPPRPH